MKTMKIGVLGTGMVGSTIGSNLVKKGHEVMMGSRTATNEKATGWAMENGELASHGTFEDAASFGELVFNCTSGMASLQALRQAGHDNLKSKILIDVANPLDFSKGMPPRLSVCNDDSLGERIQNAFPGTKVVKTLNTLNCELMLEPHRLKEDHDIFMSGNDDSAKQEVRELLESFGWKTIIDLGDISTARGTEMLLPLWVRLWGTFQSPHFNFKIVR